MNKNRYQITISLFLFFLINILSSCSSKKNQSPSLVSKTATIPLYIGMPKNNCGFENISPLIYQAIAHHFKRTGYRITPCKKDGYVLRLTIKNLSPAGNFISPDMLLFHTTMKLELTCELINFAQECIQQKTFFFSTLLSKPRNPIINSSFLEYEYKKLIDRSVPKIEQYFRQQLLSNC